MATSELCTILFSLSLFLRFIGVLTESPVPPFCNASSCGKLQDIRYPFRLAGDPPPCGMPGYELSCEGNRAVLHFLSARYYVLNISYETNIIRVVDVSLASGSCSLPPQSLSWRSFPDDERFSPASVSWAAFVNCSRRIDDTMYASVACMSTGSRHVYLAHGGIAIESLQPTCHFVSLIPLTEGADESLTSGADIHKALQMGFDLSWFGRGGRASTTQIVRICLGDTFRLYYQNIRKGQFLSLLFALEKNFCDCLRHANGWENNRRFRSKVDRGSAAVLTALLAALHLVIVLALMGRFIFAPMAIFVHLIRKFQEAHVSIDTVEKFLQKQRTLMPARFTYPEIVSMTNHFHKKLGEGGFGCVFLGKLPGGYSVAVKMLSNSKCNGEEFISEVSTIGCIHHVHVMQLIGFCSEGANRALVYEYMPNGSLDRYIIRSNGRNSSLSWEKLNEIALGIARGIEYLHSGCDMCILHFDIKPHNILLDHNFAPKVSDFGLAKLYPKDNSLVSVSAARGTIGYIAPELISRSFGVISSKSDVYSFGMLLLEMAGARNGINTVVEKSSDIYFPQWMYDRLCVQSVLSQDDIVEIGEIERKLCMVALWCIQMKPSDRPSMTVVIEMLEGSTHALQMPPKPFFSSVPISAARSYLDISSEMLSDISEV